MQQVIPVTLNFKEDLRQYMAFIKFGQSEHVEQLKNEGIIYMNTFDYFKNCEDKEKGDQHENINFLGKAGHCEVYLNKHKLSKEGGFIDVKINAPHLNKPYLTHLFCMSSIIKGDAKRDDFKIFDDKLKNFGNTLLLIYNPYEFINRLNKALSKGYEDNLFTYQTKRVEYVDFKIYNGDIGAFIKDISYSHQKEWRLGINCNYINQPFILKIGSLKDISETIPIEKWKNKITPKGDGYYNYEF